MSIEQMLFLLLLLVVGILAFQSYSEIWAKIRLGKSYDGAPDLSKRWKNVLLIAFGQKKMFKKVLPALFHLFIYVAFLMTQIELIEIIIDGASGHHRTFASSLGWFYTLTINLIEWLSVLAFIATAIFLWRRNVLKIGRFEKVEMDGWPKRDANLILLGEILLILGILTMNGADTQLQTLGGAAYYPETGKLMISSFIGDTLFADLDLKTLLILERSGWWLHLTMVFGFLLYLPVSKHLHILLAFPNTYWARQKSPGTMQNMPEVMVEVKSMLGLTTEAESAMSTEIPEFGAKDVTDLTWKNILDAYTCTECGRCTAVCPANLTGKKLSPRKVVMDVRDRADEVREKLRSADSNWVREEIRIADVQLNRDNFEDGQSLFDRITREELYACTSCNACVEACPVLIDPLEVILEMRRYDILTLAGGPQDWLPMFNSLENSGSVWQVTTDRDALIDSK
jgi:heterodisulfide reductase subunit C